MAGLKLAAFLCLGLASSLFALAQEDIGVKRSLPSQDVNDILGVRTDEGLVSSVDDLLQSTPQAAQENVLETGQEPPEEETEADQSKVSYEPYQIATLRALDKITGRATDITIKTDTPIVFGSLNIDMKICYQTPPELPPESVAFLSIRSVQAVQVKSMKKAVNADDVGTVSDDDPILFSGWMFASSPGLSALEHPVYDVWVISCKAD